LGFNGFLREEFSRLNTKKKKKEKEMAHVFPIVVPNGDRLRHLSLKIGELILFLIKSEIVHGAENILN
jgi:hypothetical protein